MDLFNYYTKEQNKFKSVKILNSKQLKVQNMNRGEVLFGRQEGCTTSALIKALNSLFNDDKEVILMIKNISSAAYVMEGMLQELEVTNIKYSSSRRNRTITNTKNNKKISVRLSNNINSMRGLSGDIIILDGNINLNDMDRHVLNCISEDIVNCRQA